MGIDIKGAGDWFKDRYEDFKNHHRATEAINEEAKAWVGKNVSKIQDVLYTQPRRDLDKIGEQGGFRGAAAKAASFGLGVGEGVFLGAKDAAAGTVGLLENVGKLLHPVEWAVKPEANLDRIKTAGQTAAALAPLANPVVNPAGLGDTVNTVQALWKGITEPYEKADVAQRIGRGAVDVASLLVGGEALLGAKGAGAAAKVNSGARHVDAGELVSPASGKLGKGEIDEPAARSGITSPDGVRSESEIDATSGADEVTSSPPQTSLADKLIHHPAIQDWGTAADGDNQGVKHFAEYWEKHPNRIPSLEKRLGLEEGALSKTVEGFEMFTDQANRVVHDVNTLTRTVNGKEIHFLKGSENDKKGVVVIAKGGKLQTMMPSDPNTFKNMR